MLAFLVLSGLLSEASLRGIRVERLLPRELFAGQPNRVVLRIHNAQRRVASFAITLEDLMAEGETEHRSGRTFALRVGPAMHTDRSYLFEPEHRGEHRFDRVRVSTRFPFGLFVKSVELDAKQECLAYPAIIETELQEEDHANPHEAFEREGASRLGVDVAELREHIPGDSLGRVNWRRSLRAGRLLVGEREGEATGQIEVRLSLSPNAPASAREQSISRAASEVVAYLESGRRVGLRSSRARIPIGRGAGHRAELLSYLARVDAEDLLTVQPRRASAPSRSGPNPR
jgi:uncharacterized protein (DUF58 family)